MEIDLEKDMVTPKRMTLYVLTGVRGGGTEADDKRPLGNEEHVAFRFDYALTGWDGVKQFAVPPEAMKILK